MIHLLQENGAAIKVQDFHLPKTFFTWAGIDSPLSDDGKEEGEEDEQEKKEKEEDEKEEEEEEAQGPHDDGKIFPLPQDIFTFFNIAYFQQW